MPWAPRGALPGWWEEVDPARPSVYVTLGSSGLARTLPAVVAELARLPVNVLVATAGRARLDGAPRHVHVADWLPGDLAARRAAVVVSNGGSSTGYQALTEGRPVVGLPWNLDQYLAMTAIAEAGAGALVRGARADPRQLRAAVEAALGGAFAAGVERARAGFARLDARARFRELVEGEVARPGRAASADP